MGDLLAVLLTAWIAMRAIGLSTKRVITEAATFTVLLGLAQWAWLHAGRRTAAVLGEWLIPVLAGDYAVETAGDRPAPGSLPSLWEGAAYAAGGATLILAAFLIAAAVNVATAALENPRPPRLRPNFAGGFAALAWCAATYLWAWIEACRLSAYPGFHWLDPWLRQSIWLRFFSSPAIPGGG
ncbi:MAG: hypothetical protein QJR01_02950 [Kyrpidia sp.]|nr:hypothetical protein [Kyrpidia sp.]